MEYSLNSWLLSTLSVYSVCPVQIVHRTFKTYFSQRAVVCTSEAHVGACAEKDDDHHYALNSWFRHSGGAGW